MIVQHAMQAAVLCAVLMGLSMGKSSGIDIFKPARPIAAPAEHRAHEPARKHEPEQQPKVVSLPAELSPQPVGSASGSLVVQRGDESSTTTLEVEETREAHQVRRRAKELGLVPGEGP